jgi:hypothetical protein
LRLGAEEIAALDELTATAPPYPRWYNAQWVDAKHKAAFGGTDKSP